MVLIEFIKIILRLIGFAGDGELKKIKIQNK